MGAKGLGRAPVTAAGHGRAPADNGRRASMESILSEDDLRSLLKKREGERRGGGGAASSVTGTEDETRDFEEAMVFDGDDAERELRAAKMEEGKQKMATPMGLAGAA